MRAMRVRQPRRGRSRRWRRSQKHSQQHLRGPCGTQRIAEHFAFDEHSALGAWEKPVTSSIATLAGRAAHPKPRLGIACEPHATAVEHGWCVATSDSHQCQARPDARSRLTESPRQQRDALRSESSTHHRVEHVDVAWKPSPRTEAEQRAPQRRPRCLQSRHSFKAYTATLWIDPIPPKTHRAWYDK